MVSKQCNRFFFLVFFVGDLTLLSTAKDTSKQGFYSSLTSSHINLTQSGLGRRSHQVLTSLDVASAILREVVYPTCYRRWLSDRTVGIRASDRCNSINTTVSMCISQDVMPLINSYGNLFACSYMLCTYTRTWFYINHMLYFQFWLIDCYLIGLVWNEISTAWG